MKCDYILDISEESSSSIHTPSLLSQQLPFYVHNCGYFVAGENYFTEREGLENYLLAYTVSGSGYLKYRGLENIIKTKQMFLINCFEYQFYKTCPNNSWEFFWVHFNGNACKSYFDLINGSSVSIVTVSQFVDIAGYFTDMIPLAIKSDIYSDLKFSMYLTNIITEMAASKLSLENNRNHLQHRNLVDIAAAFIEKNFREKINMCDLVKLVHISEFHFLRVFKKYTGMSPYEYLINYRINKSKLLLKETNLAISEVSDKVGFNNINNFIRDFKKLVGTTPLKYRNYWIG